MSAGQRLYLESTSIARAGSNAGVRDARAGSVSNTCRLLRVASLAPVTTPPWSVSRDRMMSVHDPEMRHGHKSSSRRFDGHKAAIVVDTDSQLITAVEVLPGNAPDNLGALELVEARIAGQVGAEG